jgi:antitoxin ParD1/3/4
MNVSLTPEIEEFIKKKVDGGLYSTSSEVVREAMRLFMDQDTIKQHRIEELRAEIEKGFASAERGELVDGDQAFAELRQMIEQRKRKSA